VGGARVSPAGQVTPGAAAGGPATPEGEGEQPLLQLRRLGTTSDGGARSHQLLAELSLPRVKPDAPDALDPDTLKWELDSEFFESAVWTDSPFSLLLTTRKLGKTWLKVSARTRSGALVRDRALVVIDAGAANLALDPGPRTGAAAREQLACAGW
jgi:hypothetical protein